MTANGVQTGDRDLRLDLFRGLANWAIFVDHVPNNAVAWITARNYGFSDAAEPFCKGDKVAPDDLHLRIDRLRCIRMILFRIAHFAVAVAA